MRRIKTLLALLAVWLAAGAGTASAGIIDLTVNDGSGNPIGASGTLNGAIFQQTDVQPTGTGVIDPFLRIQMKGNEQGYNTDTRPIQSGMDTKQDPWTRSIQLSDIPVVNVGGTNYYQFLLDINENNSTNGHLLSLDKLQIFQAGDGTLDNYQGLTTGLAGATKVYDMGGDGTTSGNWVALDYGLNHGSGSGDMFLYVPTTNFDPSFGQYVYLYSAFGNIAGYESPNTPPPPLGDYSSDAGFEEWAALTNTPRPPPLGVPAPPSLVLLGLGGLGLLARGRFGRRQAV